MELCDDLSVRGPGPHGVVDDAQLRHGKVAQGSHLGVAQRAGRDDQLDGIFRQVVGDERVHQAVPVVGPATTGAPHDHCVPPAALLGLQVRVVRELDHGLEDPAHDPGTHLVTDANDLNRTVEV